MILYLQQQEEVQMSICTYLNKGMSGEGNAGEEWKWGIFLFNLLHAM